MSENLCFEKKKLKFLKKCQSHESAATGKAWEWIAVDNLRQINEVLPNEDSPNKKQ